MEHILNPLSPTTPQLEVPFLGIHYDHVGFYDFPVRMGLSEEDVVDGTFGSWSAAETAAFLQAWLYFGVIDQVVGGGISGCTLDSADPQPIMGRYEFIDRRPGGRDVISTSRLPLRMRQWHQTTLAMSAARKAASGKFIEENLLFARRMAKEYLQPEGAKWGLWPLDETVTMSLLVLYSTLGTFAYTIYDGMNADVTKFGRSSLLDRQLDESGFPYVTNFHVRLCHQYYLSRLYWPRFEDCEAQGRSRGSETSVESYVTKHVVSECDCIFIAVDKNELRNIILQGRVPLLKVDLRYTARDGLQPNLTLESYDLETEKVPGYVAISHVWVDGLGNRVENALPECQLIQLTRMVSDTMMKFAIGSIGYAILPRSRIYFWLDTLCVPIDRDLKGLALRSMRDIFEGAMVTLVLDRGLMSTSVERPMLRASRSRADHGFARAVEIMARITTSAWFQRLWTLQEAVFSETLYVQFSDCQVIPIREVKRIADAEFPKSRSPESRTDLVGEEFALKYSNAMKGVISRATPCQKLNRLHSILRSRFTAKWEDESTCIATILDIDLNIVVQTKPEDRMAAVLKTFREIPSGLAFDPGARYEEEGMGWAPKSLLRHTSGVTVDISGTTTGTSGPHGLTIQSVGFIRPYAKWLQHLVVFRDRDESNDLMWAALRYGEIEPSNECHTEEGSRALAERIQRRYSKQLNAGCEELGIIVNPVEASQIDQVQSRTNCLMVNVTDRTPGLITGRVVCYVEIVPFSVAHYAYSPDLAELFDTVSGERTAPDQKWCLS